MMLLISKHKKLPYDLDNFKDKNLINLEQIHMLNLNN